MLCSVRVCVGPLLLVGRRLLLQRRRFQSRTPPQRDRRTRGSRPPRRIQITHRDKPITDNRKKRRNFTIPARGGGEARLLPHPAAQFQPEKLPSRKRGKGAARPPSPRNLEAARERRSKRLSASLADGSWIKERVEISFRPGNNAESARIVT